PLMPACELITVEFRPNVSRWRVGEGIVGQQAQSSAVIVQQLPNEMKGPRVLIRTRHGCKPDLPVQPIVVGADNTGTAKRISRLALDLNRCQSSFRRDPFVSGTLKNDLAPFPADAAEGAVRVDEMQGIEGSIHGLPARQQIRHWEIA